MLACTLKKTKTIIIIIQFEIGGCVMKGKKGLQLGTSDIKKRRKCKLRNVNTMQLPPLKHLSWHQRIIQTLKINQLDQDKS